MKRTFCISAFSILYAILLSFVIECFLYLLGMSFVISLESYYNPFVAEPVFFPFCLIVFFVALLVLAILLFINFVVSERLEYIKKTWLWQMIIAVIVAIFLIKPWEILFDILIKIW